MDIHPTNLCKNTNLKLTCYSFLKTNFVPLRLQTFAPYIMSRKIKLIWDFRGTVAAKTAEHHEVHLKEFIQKEKLDLDITGFKIIDEMYALAFMVVNEEDMIIVRDALKPHRGEVYVESVG